LIARAFVLTIARSIHIESERTFRDGLKVILAVRQGDWPHRAASAPF